MSVSLLDIFVTLRPTCVPSAPAREHAHTQDCDRMHSLTWIRVRSSRASPTGSRASPSTPGSRCSPPRCTTAMSSYGTTRWEPSLAASTSMTVSGWLCWCEPELQVAPCYVNARSALTMLMLPALVTISTSRSCARRRFPPVQRPARDWRRRLQGQSMG